MNYEELPERLARLENVEAFAGLAGVDAKTIRNIIRGSNSPTLDTCRKIAAALREHRPKLKPKAPPAPPAAVAGASEAAAT